MAVINFCLVLFKSVQLQWLMTLEYFISYFMLFLVFFAQILLVANAGHILISSKRNMVMSSQFSWVSIWYVFHINIPKYVKHTCFSSMKVVKTFIFIFHSKEHLFAKISLKEIITFNKVYAHFSFKLLSCIHCIHLSFYATYIFLGTKPAIVLCSLDAVREAYISKQNDFAGRPKTYSCMSFA